MERVNVLYLRDNCTAPRAVVDNNIDQHDSKVTMPPMHIGFGMKGYGPPIGNRAHIPTGRVPVEDVITFLIRELEVQSFPDGAASNIIARARERFMEHKSW